MQLTPNKQNKCLLVSDFNISTFAGYLSNNNALPSICAEAAPFGQLFQVLLDGSMDCWRHDHEYVLVWTRPESVSPSFDLLLNYDNSKYDKIINEVDAFSDALLSAKDRAQFVFVPSWVTPTYVRGLGVIDMRQRCGIQSALMRMNLRLAENVEKSSNIYLLNTSRWIEMVGANAYSPKLWYLTKVAFSNAVFLQAVSDVKAACRAVKGQSRKIVILDMDDTIWGGTVGEVGWQNVVLGGHDHVGEAFVDFQKALKSLTQRGIILAIVSKNDEKNVFEVFDNHSEMILEKKDFAGWRINWQDKAKNIAELLEELRLGPQSAVFIDNSPHERALIKNSLPDVFVPEWPLDVTLYKSSLLALDCFDTAFISNEDQSRVRMYAEERDRESLRFEIPSIEEWLKKLNIRVLASDLNDDNLQRAAQLLNKTNQMNLRTRRMSEKELKMWADNENNFFWVFRVMDQFGDSGISGLAGLKIERDQAIVTDYVLSCRVLGRHVENAIAFFICDYAQKLKLRKIIAEYAETEKNKPCLDFFKKSGLEYEESKPSSFFWNTNRAFLPPEHIELVYNTVN